MTFSFHGREVCQDLVIASYPQFITCSVIGHLTVDNGRVVRLFMFFTGVRQSVAACRTARPGEIGPLLVDKAGLFDRLERAKRSVWKRENGFRWKPRGGRLMAVRLRRRVF